MKLSTVFSISVLAAALSLHTHAQQTTSYTYNDAGQVLTEDGPRTDVSDVTTHTYTTQGQLASTTNARGHVTAFNSYDASGNLLSMTLIG